ncbi:MAG: hypothetical protein R3D66_01420 [Alphaproteobacteria bacterium]
MENKKYTPKFASKIKSSLECNRYDTYPFSAKLSSGVDPAFNDMVLALQKQQIHALMRLAEMVSKEKGPYKMCISPVGEHGDLTINVSHSDLSMSVNIECNVKVEEFYYVAIDPSLHAGKNFSEAKVLENGCDRVPPLRAENIDNDEDIWYTKFNGYIKLLRPDGTPWGEEDIKFDLSSLLKRSLTNDPESFGLRPQEPMYRVESNPDKFLDELRNSLLPTLEEKLRRESARSVAAELDHSKL